MDRTIRIRTIFIAALILLSSQGCKHGGSDRESKVEKPIPVATPVASQTQGEPSPPAPPPTVEEVANVLHRVFEGDVTLDTTAHPSFVAGDFNGDQSQDLAVIVRPVNGKLADINNELANWIIQDANVYFIPPDEKHVVKVPVLPAAKVMEGEELLAIVHGYGRDGWRNPQARQGYLIKHAAATLLRLGSSASEKSIREMHLPVETEIIYERRNNKMGFLFWTGQAYAWHDGKG